MTDKDLIYMLRNCPNISCGDCEAREICDSLTDGFRKRLDSYVADRLESLIAENEHLRESTKMVTHWHPASEPPEELYEEDGCLKNYLIFSPEDGIDIGNYLKEARCWFDFGCPVLITHWAKLPEPPSTEGAEND